MSHGSQALAAKRDQVSLLCTQLEINFSLLVAGN